MRKIEQQMNQLQSGNTAVTHSRGDVINGPVSHVFLHGNKIAILSSVFLMVDINQRPQKMIL